jgi:hypothetical protein
MHDTKGTFEKDLGARVDACMTTYPPADLGNLGTVPVLLVFLYIFLFPFFFFFFFFFFFAEDYEYVYFLTRILSWYPSEVVSSIYTYMYSSFIAKHPEAIDCFAYT